MNINIETTDPRIHYSLSHETPEGANIISDQPIIRKGFDVEVVVNVDIAIDLTKISAIVVGAWLYKNTRRSRGRSNIYIDGNQIPIDQSEIEKELQDAVEHKEAKDD